MSERYLVHTIVGLIFLALAAPARAGVVVFTDIDEFRAAAGPLVEIDFNMLPDGVPSPDFVGVDITPEFNYTEMGVTFSSPVGNLRVVGSGDHDLLASAQSKFHTWIEAEFEPLTYAIGMNTFCRFTM